jgi:FMN-binding domain
MNHLIRLAVLMTLGMLATTSWAQRGVFLEPGLFLSQAFSQNPEPKTLWLNNDSRPVAEAIAGRSLPLRTRYYQQGQRTAWILEEIGKELPITLGIVVENEQVIALRVLEYREVRGGEVRYDFFTQQFVGAQLTDKNIDGIAGATLSVRALKKTARLALYLHQQALTATAAKP